MKNLIRILTTAVLALSLPAISFASVAAIAQPTESTTPTTTSQEPTTTNESTSSTSNTDDGVQDNPQAADFKVKLQERIEKRKAELKTQLTKAQQTRVKERCKAAQGLISSVSTKTKEFKTNRSEVYGKIVDRLTKLSATLKQNNIDTTELDKQIADLQTMITTFNTDLAEMRQSAADISNMDCASDTTGFKAALETMRTKRETVAKDSAAIRTQLKDMIKPTLDKLKASFKETKTEDKTITKPATGGDQ